MFLTSKRIEPLRSVSKALKRKCAYVVASGKNKLFLILGFYNLPNSQKIGHTYSFFTMTYTDIIITVKS